MRERSLRFAIIALAGAILLVGAAGAALTLTGEAQGSDPGVEQLVAFLRHQQNKTNAYRVKYRKMRRYARKLERDNGRKTRILLHEQSVREALRLAGTVYGNYSTLKRRAWCESKFDPTADNGAARGLLQFLDSTWDSTPFASFSVFSPYANALAAGWMIGPAGRGGEWSCK